MVSLVTLSIMFFAHVQAQGMYHHVEDHYRAWCIGYAYRAFGHWRCPRISEYVSHLIDANIC
jgi:hypothetical protein